MLSHYSASVLPFGCIPQDIVDLYIATHGCCLYACFSRIGMIVLLRQVSTTELSTAPQCRIDRLSRYMLAVPNPVLWESISVDKEQTCCQSGMAAGSKVSLIYRGYLKNLWRRLSMSLPFVGFGQNLHEFCAPLRFGD